MHCEGVCLYSYESGCDFQHAYRVSVRVGVVRMCVWVSEIEQTRKVKKAKGIVDTKRERERERKKSLCTFVAMLMRQLRRNGGRWISNEIKNGVLLL